MIILPTKKRLESRRNVLYEQLYSILQYATSADVEYIMRKIHIINQKINIYFQREHEPREIFED